MCLQKVEGGTQVLQLTLRQLKAAEGVRRPFSSLRRRPLNLYANWQLIEESHPCGTKNWLEFSPVPPYLFPLRVL